MKKETIILAVCISMALIGCASLQTERSTDESGGLAKAEKPLGVAANLRFEDIPIPVGFATLQDQSFIFQDASVRVGLLRYSGRAKANQVTAFFKAQMGLYNWELQNIVEHGVIALNFIKSDEMCVITIEPLTTKTILNIVISPRRGTMTTGFSAGSKRDKF